MTRTVKKKTIVRAIHGLLGVADVVAPRLVARQVARRWFTLPPGPRPRPMPDGGRAFEVDWGGGVVRGHSWGSGPVVYLVHGWGGRADQFAVLVPALIRAGLQVVAFDAPSHGSSGPGRLGSRSSTGVEFAQALDAVFARFGPAEAVIAHSMGALATLLALDRGWLGTERLVFLAPMTGYRVTMDMVQAAVGFGSRTRKQVDRRIWATVGLAPEDFELDTLWRRLDEPLPTLVVQDLDDRQAPYWAARDVAAAIGARLTTTSGLGHNRVLQDRDVVARVVGFVSDVGGEVTLPATA